MSEGLEALERIGKAYISKYRYVAQDNDFELIEKELKAFEIIKTKEVNVHNFKICLEANWPYELFEENTADIYEWNELAPYQHSMTKEEFNLLKEALL